MSTDLVSLISTYLSEKGLNISDYTSRKVDVMKIKHSFRYFTRFKLDWTENRLVEFEYKMCGEKPDRSTVWNSVEVVRTNYVYYGPIVIRFIKDYENVTWNEYETDIYELKKRILELEKDLQQEKDKLTNLKESLRQVLKQV